MNRGSRVGKTAAQPRFGRLGHEAVNDGAREGRGTWFLRRCACGAVYSGDVMAGAFNVYRLNTPWSWTIKFCFSLKHY